MKRVYGLRDNTTEHSEYKRLAEQLMRPEWAQLRIEWKWAVTEQRAHGQKTGWRTPDRVLKVKAAVECRLGWEGCAVGCGALRVVVRS